MIPASTRRRSRKRDARAATIEQSVRVAIYTRKSVDKGEDVAFGSIDAQRERVEAYVTSQAGQGWVALETRYDDLGYSGATTSRPAFQQLLADIEAGHVDAVAVYRLDRLSRAQLDFLKLLEFLDSHGVTFVSVTEAFNTTTPMGRFALGLLIQVAQLEREVIAERVRDKVHASRRKGLFTGGRPVLGYDIRDNALVVNDDEAARARAIFALYLERGSLMATADELRARGWRNKRWTSKRGNIEGGHAFDKGSLHRLLTNPVVVGKIRAGDEICKGVHEAIVDEGTWRLVQQQLDEQGQATPRRGRHKWDAMLRGLFRCACGAGMTHHYTSKTATKRYRYYVCERLQKEGRKACPGSRLPAKRAEDEVADRLKTITSDPALQAEVLVAARERVAEHLAEIDAERKRVDAHLRRLATERDRLQGADADDREARERLLELAQEIELAEARAHDVREDRARAAAMAPDATDLGEALRDFAPIWDVLVPPERARLVALLVEEASYDAGSDQIEVAFRPLGLTALADELQGEAAA